jgi:hypothetical protein
VYARDTLRECDTVSAEQFEPTAVSFVDTVGVDNTFINDGSSTTGCNNDF